MIKKAPSHRLFLPTKMGLAAVNEQSRFPPGCVRSIESELSRFFLRNGGQGRESLNAQRYLLGLYGKLGAPSAAEDLKSDLLYFFANETESGKPSGEFFAVFQPDEFAEEEFFQAFRSELSHLAAEEAFRRTVNRSSFSFNFSLDGLTFVVSVLHPTCPERELRFRYPTLVFRTEEKVSLALVA